MDTLPEIRKKVKQRISAMGEQMHLTESVAIMTQVENLHAFRKAKVIVAYWSVFGEVYTHDLIRKWAEQKVILLPVIENNKLILKQFTGQENMEEGVSYAVPEPVGKEFTDLEKVDLIILPGLAFDRERGRIGRGHGYFNELIKKINAHRVGVCFNVQIFDSLPREKDFVEVDTIVYS